MILMAAFESTPAISGAPDPAAYPQGPVTENLARVRDRIAEAARRAGRRPEEVRLVAVSKRQPAAKVLEAYAAGHRLFGENYVQEALAKMEQVPGDAHWHLIGHLQTNKAKLAVGRFACIETVDSPKAARAIGQRAAAAGSLQEVLVQVNWSQEASKAGVTGEGALRAMFDELAGLEALRVRGLMTIPDPNDAERELRGLFGQMRGLLESLRGEFGLGAEFGELSMGMSHDYPWAIEEGATLVRVGTAIFGARS